MEHKVVVKKTKSDNYGRKYVVYINGEIFRFFNPTQVRAVLGTHFGDIVEGHLPNSKSVTITLKIQ